VCAGKPVHYEQHPPPSRRAGYAGNGGACREAREGDATSKQSGNEWQSQAGGCGECERVHWYTRSIQSGPRRGNRLRRGAVRSPPSRAGRDVCTFR